MTTHLANSHSTRVKLTKDNLEKKKSNRNLIQNYLFLRAELFPSSCYRRISYWGNLYPSGTVSEFREHIIGEINEAQNKQSYRIWKQDPF